MIRYTLKCPAEHRFEAWFASSADFDRLRAAGHVTCVVCGGGGVEKTLMAPSVAVARPEAAAPETETETAPLARPPAARALAELRRRLLEKAEGVGRDFAREARRIHAGEAPDRPIWGEAQAEEARALLEDGIPVAPLPPDPSKAN
jgi:hypothetical protein